MQAAPTSGQEVIVIRECMSTTESGNDGDGGSRRHMNAGQRPQQRSAMDLTAYGKSFFKKKR
jgi:hypothetical protein